MHVTTQGLSHPCELHYEKQDRQSTYNAELQDVHVTNIAVEMQQRICFFFPLAYLKNRIILWKNVLNENAFSFCLRILSKTFVILRRTQRDIVVNVRTSSIRLPLMLRRFLIKLEFLDRFLKTLQ